MVDINLLGDDKTGTGTGETEESDHVEDFTQTSSMDTQELAFEERTETFDTTKTAGFAHRRSYSSLLSTMVILAVIVLLGWGIYFFMFKDKGTPIATELADFSTDTEDFTGDLPDDPGDNAADFSTTNNEPDQASDFQQDIQQQQPENIQEDIQLPKPQTPQPRPQRPVARTPVNPSSLDLTPVASQFLANSKNAITGVTNVLSSVPSNLSVTLLSYTAQRVRIEVVANSSAEARDFAGMLSQNFGGGFSVVSDNPVASNGITKQKVLLTGNISSGGRAADGARFLSLSDAQGWIRETVERFGLQLRQLQTQPGSFVSDYQRTPILLRVYGSQSAIVNFLDEMDTQSINVELTKILLVSPDMVTHSDDNLVLVINMFLYESS